MSEEMFNLEEALTLLEDSWGIKDVEKRLKNDRKALIDEAILLIQEKVIFQTISVLACPPENIKRPTFEDIKQNCVSGLGGVCYSINVFTCCLLKALGFSAEVSCATVDGAFNPDTHVVVLVNDLLKPNDLYLIDSGCGHPTFGAVALDFDTESPVYHDSFIKRKYVRKNGMILRMHMRENSENLTPQQEMNADEIWKVFYSFIPAPDSLEELTIHTDFSTIIPKLWLTQTPRAILFKNRKAVIIMGDRVMIEKEEGRLETAVLYTDEDIVKAYGIHFPTLAEENVRKAIARWRDIQQQT